MNYNYLHYQIAMTRLTGIGPVRARALLSKVPDPEELLTASDKKLGSITGLSQTIIRELGRGRALEDADAVIQHMEKNGIQTCFYTDPDFPRRLNTCPDGPLVLYSKGTFRYNHTRVVAIVGTRDATAYGKELCRALIESFQGRDITVVSGLALGIDSWAHHYCVEYGIPTIGVLGHGLDRIYPALNRALADQILHHGGLVTEFIPGTDPDRENFPKRNRIVAGLSDATIVVESRARGGSLITAQLANEYNRDVFAFPGNVSRATSAGCNDLIATQQAHLLSSPDSFLEMMGWNDISKEQHIQRTVFSELSCTQQRIVEVLASVPVMPIDILSVKTSMPITTLHSELFQLEMDGIVRSLPGKSYTMA